MDMIILNFQSGTDLERAKTISGAVNFIMDKERSEDKEVFVKEALMLIKHSLFVLR